MSERTRARAILAALLLAITVVGIRVAGPAVGWAPPTGRVVIIIGITLEAALAALLVVVLRRQSRGRPLSPAASRPRENQAITANASSPDDLATRMRVILTRILGTGLFAIPVAVALFFLHEPRIAIRPRRLPPSPPGGHHLVIGQARTSGSGGSIALTIFQYVLIAALIVAVVAIVYLAWLRRAARLPATNPLIDEMIEFPAELALAFESGRRALRELDDARAAIIGCYLAMEASLAKAGAARRAAETPDELLARAVAGDLVSAEPASQLTALFYEARFSSHPMPPTKRDEAERALAELAATVQPARPAASARSAGGTPR